MVGITISTRERINSFWLCGPGNPLNNGKPVNELDVIFERHDHCYLKPNGNKNNFNAL